METTDAAISELQDRLFEIYHRAGREVTYTTDTGEERAYWPKRFLQALRRAVSEGDEELIDFVSRLVTSAEPSRGFGYLLDNARLDLTVEAVVADETAPFHPLFDRKVVEAARGRLAKHGYEHGRSQEQKPARRFTVSVEVFVDGHGDPGPGRPPGAPR
jgi:hypothetical protein